MLIAFRFVLGFGVGGDYPVSAVLMSEYANRKDRGKLVGMVFSTQALGLIVGPLIALALLGAGAGNDLAWRSCWRSARCPPRPCSTCAAQCPSRRGSRLRCRAATSTRWLTCPGSPTGR